MSDRTRQVRRSLVAECVAALPIEPLLARDDEPPFEVMRRVVGQPETRLLGVIDETGVLVGVVSIVRLAEAVIAVASPETILADIQDVSRAADFGHAVTARTIADVMAAPASIGAEATLDEAFRTMHARHLSGLYVVDAAGRPTGYLDLLEVTVRYLEALEADRADAD